MAELGAQLREARMRQRIDITDMEMRTKIRAKYLRALENEEWDLLPGPTYVRSFLRTYADALGLDSKLIVEEYKLRHDPLETGELHPIRRPTQRERDRRRRAEPRGVPRAAVIGGVLAVIVVALFLIGKSSDSGNGGGAVGTMGTQPSTNAGTQQGAAKKKASKKAAAPARTVRLQLVPTAPVSVCLTDATGQALINNATLVPGQPTRTFRSKRFKVVLGNNGVTMRVNARARTVPPSAGPIAYLVTPKGRRTLPPDQRPTCRPAA